MPETAAVRVIIVDDHPLLRDGLTALLEAHGGFTVVAAVATGEEAVDAVSRLTPDITIMDLGLQGMDGIAAIQAIRKRDPQARILALTNQIGAERIYQALEAGADGYLFKTAGTRNVIAAIRDVLNGKRHLPSDVGSQLATQYPRVKMSPRESEVLSLVARGLRNKEIAHQLSITEATVKIHVQNIMSKLDAADRTEAVVAAMRRGILPSPGQT